MKLVGVREAQASLSGLVETAQKEKIVLTRHGKPVAVLTGVEGQDMEEVMLSQDPGFAKLIEQRRKPGPLVSHADVRAIIEGQGQAKAASSRAKKTGRRKRTAASA